MTAQDRFSERRYSPAAPPRRVLSVTAVAAFVILLASSMATASTKAGPANAAHEAHSAGAMAPPSTGEATPQKRRRTKRRAKPGSAKPKPKAASANPIAVIDTDAGVIKVELLKSEAPQTVENFVKLAGRAYYNGGIFHRVISGFMIQGGDPTGTGRGGETATGQPLPNEINPSSPLYQGGYKRGAVAMANKGRPESGSSQFFIMHADYPLPPNYTIFGRVIEGIETVDKIATAPTRSSTQGENSSPVNPVKIKSVTIK